MKSEQIIEDVNNSMSNSGNNKIVILKYFLEQPNNNALEGVRNSIDISIRNISIDKIASALFEAVFYDSNGNTIDKVKHREIEIDPNHSRSFLITSDYILPKDMNVKLAESCKVTLLKVTTSEVERVQLRRHEIRTSENGGEEVRGVVKNISDVRTDAALIATFKDEKDEKIGIKVLLLKDIEPCSVKSFHFIFNAPENEKVKTYTLNIGEII
jgi:hypothetical protein